jgi:TIR domain
MPNAKKKTVLHQVEPENPAAKSAMRRIIFISHSNPEDNDFTTWLAARLALAGYEVWSDITKLIGGEVFWKDIEEAIRHHSIKFLSVLSVSAPSKRGFMKELSVADAIEGQGKLGDFIIPVRIDDIPFSDIPIQIHNKNVIDFTAGWHLGLARILKKFEQDKVPQSLTDLATSLSEWAKGHLDLERGVRSEDQTLMSNWFSIENLPSTLRISSFTLTPVNIEHLQRQWPARLVGSRVVSFARTQDFDLPGEFANLRSESEIETEVFLRSGASSLAQLTYNDRRNVVTDLLGQAWRSYAKDRGLLSLTLASGNQCWFLSAPAGKAERVPFTDALGKAGKRALYGKSEKLGAHWHLALELQPSVGKHHRYAALTHVVFTSDGKTLLPSARHQHRLRRSFCKQWWQDRWRDLISAYIAKLGQGAGALAIPLAPLRTVTVSLTPQIFVSPVSAILEEPVAALEALHDDADLLYDPDADDDLQDIDDDDASGESE